MKYSYRDTKSYYSEMDSTIIKSIDDEPQPIGPIMEGFAEVIERAMKLSQEGKIEESRKVLQEGLWCLK